MRESGHALGSRAFIELMDSPVAYYQFFRLFKAKKWDVDIQFVNMHKRMDQLAKLLAYNFGKQANEYYQSSNPWKVAAPTVGERQDQLNTLRDKYLKRIGKA